MPFGNEQELAQIRDQCRALAVANEFAINGHENRISYIVGSGHAYRAAAGRGQTDAEPLVGEVQAVLDEFMRLNRWHAAAAGNRPPQGPRRRVLSAAVRRRRRHHAGAVRRAGPGGRAQRSDARPVGQLRRPDRSGRRGDRAWAIGSTAGWSTPAEIQHRKANVDANVKRGLPLFYPVRKNLRRAEKLLRNMSVVAEIQSAIAVIRKHTAATAAGLGQFVANQADLSVTSAATGRTSHFRRYAPGTILDAVAGTDYEFPAAGIDAARYVTVLQAELRAIASRLVMPEFMLSSDASNANYSSTMVAEGPAVKMFDRLQHEMLARRYRAVLAGRVVTPWPPAGFRPTRSRSVEIRGIPPTLAVRDRLKDAQADQILVRNGAMSVQTMAMRNGLDPEQEQGLIRRRDRPTRRSRSPLLGVTTCGHSVRPAAIIASHLAGSHS